MTLSPLPQESPRQRPAAATAYPASVVGGPVRERLEAGVVEVDVSENPGRPGAACAWLSVDPAVGSLPHRANKGVVRVIGGAGVGDVGASGKHNRGGIRGYQTQCSDLI